MKITYEEGDLVFLPFWVGNRTGTARVVKTFWCGGAESHVAVVSFVDTLGQHQEGYFPFKDLKYRGTV